MSRTWVDNRRYFREGGQAGFETKRGCPGECVYCADPVAKGKRTRTRPPGAVADELERLLEQGIDHLHTCDGEFNLPAWHALEVCREIARRGLGDRLRWYAYCSPAPFSRELARAMREAGCVGINFGADNGDPGMLRRLGRGFTPADILNATRWSKEAGMAVMLDLLLGSPGETRESLVRTVELMKQADADRVGVSVGVRVYPGTELARSRGVTERLLPRTAGRPFRLRVARHAHRRRPAFSVLRPVPARPELQLQRQPAARRGDRRGYRGAYWDILRRYK